MGRVLVWPSGESQQGQRGRVGGDGWFWRVAICRVSALSLHCFLTDCLSSFFDRLDIIAVSRVPCRVFVCHVMPLALMPSFVSATFGSGSDRFLFFDKTVATVSSYRALFIRTATINCAQLPSLFGGLRRHGEPF